MTSSYISSLLTLNHLFHVIYSLDMSYSLYLHSTTYSHHYLLTMTDSHSKKYNISIDHVELILLVSVVEVHNYCISIHHTYIFDQLLQHIYLLYYNVCSIIPECCSYCYQAAFFIYFLKNSHYLFHLFILYAIVLWFLKSYGVTDSFSCSLRTKYRYIYYRFVHYHLIYYLLVQYHLINSTNLFVFQTQGDSYQDDQAFNSNIFQLIKYFLLKGNDYFSLNIKN